MKKSYIVLILGLVAAVATNALVGCSNDDDRKPTQAEGAAADSKRQSYIDSLNIPEDQKARMKAQMGGGAVPNPADAARTKGESQSGRRN